MTASQTHVSEAPLAETPPPKPRKTNWYGAFWRWHFYGSLIVIPIMFVLSVTGMTYMFRAHIDAWTHPGVLTVDVPVDAQRLPLAEQETAVRTQFPDRPILSVIDNTGDRATVFVTERANGESANVYVDPYQATVTGELTADQLISDWAERIHGDLLIGENGLGDRIVELGASWAIVLAITGFIIFFLGRKPLKSAVSANVRGAKTRNFHALVGLPVGLGILMLVVSGLPWTGVWGSYAQQIASGNGTSLWGQDPGAESESTMKELIEDTNGVSSEAGWAMGNGPQATSNGSGALISVDDAAAVAREQGTPEPYSIIYPVDETGVFSVMGNKWNNNGNPAEEDVSLEQTVHVDQYSGQAISQYGYDDYTFVAKAVSHGIAIHEGHRFGVVNTIMSTLFCLAVIFMCVTGPLMWWTRRGTASGIAAPRAKLPVWGNWILLVTLAALGVFLPLFGLSLIAILALDLLVIRRVPRLKKFFGTV